MNATFKKLLRLTALTPAALLAAVAASSVPAHAATGPADVVDTAVAQTVQGRVLPVDATRLSPPAEVGVRTGFAQPGARSGGVTDGSGADLHGTDLNGTLEGLTASTLDGLDGVSPAPGRRARTDVPADTDGPLAKVGGTVHKALTPANGAEGRTGIATDCLQDAGHAVHGATAGGGARQRGDHELLKAHCDLGDDLVSRSNAVTGNGLPGTGILPQSAGRDADRGMRARRDGQGPDGGLDKLLNKLTGNDRADAPRDGSQGLLSGGLLPQGGLANGVLPSGAQRGMRAAMPASNPVGNLNVLPAGMNLPGLQALPTVPGLPPVGQG
ncbi:hypothetical protein [Actinomadura parmotrematis]|uniref:Uncharacterized protein n=1 Tax=Actinomadura parmotrematis TaxID=2864039 RepID=A0ABS7FRE1_9ACTN|nr:hypothetical protein [Actinomadura parmotrematis]MBW8482972.1 hypothetical protein [Actinomadura parmotrematis]